MKQILAILLAALLFGQTSAFAETKEIISEGTYNMGDGETPTVAESRALLQAKRKRLGLMWRVIQRQRTALTEC